MFSERESMTDTAARLKAALLDPAAVFRSPDQIEHDPTLSREDKLAILESWEADARELAVAEEENMAGGEPSRLDEVVAARVRVEGAQSQATGSTTTEAPPQKVGHFIRPARDTIHADHDIDEAALGLSLQERPILPVSDGDEIVGVIARADLDRAREASGPTRLTARDIMTAELALCYQDDDVKLALALMDRHGCDHLLVVDSERTLVGILDRKDLPSVSAADVRSALDEPGVLESHEENAQSIASTAQPGGLKVYAQSPTIKKKDPD
jgi:CBS domain-containing protein